MAHTVSPIMIRRTLTLTLLTLLACAPPSTSTPPDDAAVETKTTASPDADAAPDDAAVEAFTDSQSEAEVETQDAGADACAPDPCRCDYRAAACSSTSSFDCGVDPILCPVEDPYRPITPSCLGKNHRLAGRSGCTLVAADTLCCVFAASD